MAKKRDIDLFDDPVEVQAQDFVSLFERSLEKPSRKLKVGDSFTAEILSVGKSESFVSTGTTLDGVLLNADLLDENQNLKFQAGDQIEVVVLRVTDDEIRVTRKGAKGAPSDFDSLEDAFDMELPVEGKISEAVNGGYRVLIQGQTAFCPFSQLGVAYGQDPTTLIGKKFDFLITQFDSRAKNLVVSRRKLLNLQKVEDESQWMKTNKVGDIVSGKVTRTEPYGAFVNLTSSGNNIEGLVHISEIGFTRIKHASEGVTVGDSVQVKILKVDEEENRLKIGLSIKQAGGISDPWMKIPQDFPVGTIVDGIVDKKEAFGLFVVLTNGINGLLPKSKWRDSLEASKYEQAKKGDAIKVRIDEIKFEERKISLGLPTDEEDNSWRDHQANASMGGAFAMAFQNAKTQKKPKS